MKRYGFLTFALAAALTIGCNSADHRDASNPPAGGAVGTAGSEDHNVSNADKDFVKDLATANIAEVELGRMAQDRAATPEVKKFAAMMVDDHTKANETLTTLASRHNITVPSAMDDKHNDLRDKLATKTGADFDKDYVDAMVDGHQDVLDKLRARVDKETLEKFKTQTRDEVTGKKAETKVEAVTILPEKSDNPVTMSINEWAANAYPTVSAHLDAVKKLQDAVKKRITN
jgi:putative membrane protein